MPQAIRAGLRATAASTLRSAGCAGRRHYAVLAPFRPAFMRSEALPFPRLRGKVPEGRMGAIGGKDVQNRRKYLVDSPQNVMIPVARNAVALLAQPVIAHCIRGTFEVLTFVHLDDEPRFNARKVNDVRPYGRLASESMAIQLPLAQPIPQRTLGWRHLRSQRARESFLAARPHR